MAKLVALFIVSALIVLAGAKKFAWSSRLLGTSEVPPNGSPGIGYSYIVVDDDTLQFEATGRYEGLTTPATASHFHAPATVSTTAPVIITIQNTAGNDGDLSASGTLTPQQWSYFQNLQVYTNVHTATFPPGEIRGQMTPAKPLNYFLTAQPWELQLGVGSSATTLTIPSAGGVDRTNNPVNALVLDGRGSIDAGVFIDPISYTRFWFFVNSDAAGASVQARLSYDFDGDGTWDRVEWFSQFWLDGDSSSWEQYRYPGTGRHTVGAPYSAFKAGVFRIEIWAAAGNSDIQLLVDDPRAHSTSRVSLPYQY